MRLLSTVIYTDKLPEARTFFLTHFPGVRINQESDHAFMVFPYAEAALEYVDATWAGVSPSQGVLIRWGLAFPDLERERLTSAGLACSELTVAHWSDNFGEKVRFFETVDPSGTRFQIYESHYGEKRQLMTTGDGTDTRKVHQQS